MGIAGTFTEWKPVAMVAPPSDNTPPSVVGYWTLDRHLEPGEHQYKYVVDGKWIHDEKKETKENEMGSKNNVIRIEDYPGLCCPTDDPTAQETLVQITEAFVEPFSPANDGPIVYPSPADQVAALEQLAVAKIEKIVEKPVSSPDPQLPLTPTSMVAHMVSETNYGENSNSENADDSSLGSTQETPEMATQPEVNVMDTATEEEPLSVSMVAHMVTETSMYECRSTVEYSNQ